MKYVRQDNCFPWVEGWDQAQGCWIELRTNWPKWLGRIARELNPVHMQMFRNFPMSYYWTTYQSEWAIDVVSAGGSVATAVPATGALRDDHPGGAPTCCAIWVGRSGWTVKCRSRFVGK
jgi:hypothetical protein